MLLHNGHGLAKYFEIILVLRPRLTNHTAGRDGEGRIGICLEGNNRGYSGQWKTETISFASLPRGQLCAGKR